MTTLPVSTLPLSAPALGPDAAVNRRVVVGMSGGVDSSTAAALLVKQGYDVVGVTLWLMKGKGQCCSEGMVDAATVCEQLGIPHHIVDTRAVFEANIVNYLVQGYQDGITPLPCSQCNRTVKFGPMITYAEQELGISWVATGHYARVMWDAATGRYQLRRALDRHKDQTYFLYDLTQAQLARVLFPLGELTKSDTRREAADMDLSTAHKPESQDLCLVEAHGSMATFLDQHLPQRLGEIVDTQGHVLGHHSGIHHYTVGQRKGLGVAAPNPLYVLRLDVAMNRVVVGERHEALTDAATVQRVNWVSLDCPATPITAQVQVRYRAEPVLATITPLPNQRAQIHFAEPQFAITPGQAAVWYEGDCLLGGGILERS
ncbi:MAG: tRNA 2-thiouridine(34) synthase MnmA [Synechococcales cyanobacterium]